MFEQTFLPAPQRGAQSLSFAASMGAQFLMVGAALLVPLFFIDVLPMARHDMRLLAPPMPKPIPVQLVAVPRAVANAFNRMLTPRIYVPRTIPRDIPVINDLPEGPAPVGPPALFHTSGDGIPGGIPGYSAPSGRLPPPPKPKPAVEATQAAPKPTGPVRVGGDVQLAKLVKQVMPIYPPLAKQARVQGTVRLMGVISKDGRIMNLQVLSGHPLLVNAAVDAVKQWIYRPTHLNGEPVEVIAPIDVNFTLTQ